MDARLRATPRGRRVPWSAEPCTCKDEIGNSRLGHCPACMPDGARLMQENVDTFTARALEREAEGDGAAAERYRALARTERDKLARVFGQR